MDCEIRAFPSLLFSLSLSLFPYFFCGQENQLTHKVVKIEREATELHSCFLQTAAILSFPSNIRMLGGGHDFICLPGAGMFRLKV